jgi:hypothetical protein
MRKEKLSYLNRGIFPPERIVFYESIEMGMIPTLPNPAVLASCPMTHISSLELPHRRIPLICPGSGNTTKQAHARHPRRGDQRKRKKKSRIHPD